MSLHYENIVEEGSPSKNGVLSNPIEEEVEKWKKKIDDLTSQKDAVIKTYAKQLYDLQNTIIQLKKEKQVLQQENELLQEKLQPNQLADHQKITSIIQLNNSLSIRVTELESQLLNYTGASNLSTGILTPPGPGGSEPSSSSSPITTTSSLELPLLDLKRTRLSSVVTPPLMDINNHNTIPQPSASSMTMSPPLQKKPSISDEFKSPNISQSISGRAYQSSPSKTGSESSQNSDDESEIIQAGLGESQLDNSTINNSSDEVGAMEALAVELAVLRRLYHVIYETPYVMDDQRTTIPLVTVHLFDWLSNEDTFMMSPKFFNSLTKIIQGISTKKDALSHFDINVYWLSSMINLYSLINQQGGDLQQFNDHMTSLIDTIYLGILNYFSRVVDPNIVNIFCYSESNEPKITPRNSSVLGMLSGRKRNHPALMAASLANVEGALRFDIEHLLTFLSDILFSLKRFYLPIKIQERFFENFMSIINRSMLNHLLTNPKLCTVANGFQIKMGLTKLEEWLDHKNIKNNVGNARKKIRQLSEAATILTLDKNILAKDDTLLPSVCPSLNILQVRQLVVSLQQADVAHKKDVSIQVIQILNQKCKFIKEPLLIGEETIKHIDFAKYI